MKRFGGHSNEGTRRQNALSHVGGSVIKGIFALPRLRAYNARVVFLVGRRPPLEGIRSFFEPHP
jgi:hypothetical protein